MKILVHHRIRGTGADGTHIRGVVSGFRKLGFPVEILSPWGVNIEDVNPDKEKLKPQRNTLIKIPRIFFELFEMMYNVLAIFRLFYHINKYNHDLIYERYAFFNISGVLISRILRIPIFLEVNFTSRTEVYPKRTKIFHFANKWIEKFIFNHVDLIIVISDQLKEDIAKYGINRKKILVLPNAVDADRFNPELYLKNKKLKKCGLDDKLIIGFVGSFYPWHGVDFLLDAFSDLIKQNNNIGLMLIGSGQLFNDIQERVTKGQMQDKVVLTGPVPHNELPSYLSCFDIGIMPDSNDYGSPMKIFEYMAMGLPIVAPRLGPIEKVIENGIQGFLFERKNLAELKNVLTTLLNDRELRDRMGRSGREKVLIDHTWDKNVAKMIKFYQDLL